MSQEKSRWWIAPDLAEALECGRSFGEWLDGRIPVASSARISKDQKKDSHGVEAQHAANERTAARTNLAIVKYYEDNDKSAAKEHVVRGAFELLVKELKQRRTGEGFRITGVICLEVERLYRRAGDYERIVDALMVDDDGVLCQSGGDLDRFVDLYSDSAEFEGLIGVARAKSEIRKISRRMRDSHKTRALKGTAVGGPRRFGWLGPDKRIDRPSNTRKNPDEWPILQQMIWDAVEGKSWNTIAKGLNARGVRTTKGNAWRATGVKDAVSNPHVCGYRMFRGQLVEDTNGKPLIGTWDKPATVKQWQVIQERVRQSRAQKGLSVTGADYTPGSFSTRTRKYLFSGFLRCGNTPHGEICDNRLNGKRRFSPKHGRDVHYYRCHQTGDKGCGLGRNGEAIDAYLTELVLQKHEQLPKDRPAPTADWEKADELTVWEEKKARLKREWLSNTVEENDYYEDLPKIEAQIRQLRKEQRQHAETQARKSTLTNTDIRARWNDFDLTQKRAAIREVLLAVIVYPLPKGRVKNGPFDPTLLKPVWRTPAPEAHPSEGEGRSAA